MATGDWYLEGYLYQQERMHRLPLEGDNFTIGRNQSCDLVLNRHDISRLHCRLTVRDGHLYVADNQSTNGSFINGLAVSDEQELLHGDILSVANTDIRIIRDHDSGPQITATQVVLHSKDDQRLLAGVRQLEQLLELRQVTTHFHAIFDLKGQVHGHEALGRGAAPDLPEAPWPLFQIAESGDLAVPLSRLFREVAISKFSEQKADGYLYLNIHPRELDQSDNLLDSLQTLRKTHPSTPIRIEIHEDGIADLTLLRDFQAGLAHINMGLAYDDFGAGRARLLEMVEVPPAVVKFDIGLIRNIHSAPQTKQHMVAALVKLVREVGSCALAEGVEHHEEFLACQDLGFELIQGYLFGKPVAVPQNAPILG